MNKHFLGPWSNNYGNNIQGPAMTGIISALFINKAICEVSPAGGGQNMLTCSNGIWPNGNDILTAAICDAGAPTSCQEVVQHSGTTMNMKMSRIVWQNLPPRDSPLFCWACPQAGLPGEKHCRRERQGTDDDSHPLHGHYAPDYTHDANQFL